MINRTLKTKNVPRWDGAIMASHRVVCQVRQSDTQLRQTVALRENNHVALGRHRVGIAEI